MEAAAREHGSYLELIIRVQGLIAGQKGGLAYDEHRFGHNLEPVQESCNGAGPVDFDYPVGIPELYLHPDRLLGDRTLP